MQNQNQPKKVSYQVQRYVQINGVQYGSGVYEVTEQIAAALDRLGAGVRQDQFIQAIAGDAPVIDASANAALAVSGQQSANIPSGIVPNPFDGSPNAPDPNMNQIQDSTGGGIGNNSGEGQLNPMNYRTNIENQTVKTPDSNSQSFNQDVSQLQASEGAGAGSGGEQNQGGAGEGSNQTQSQGATGALPDDFPKVDDLRKAGIKTYEDLIPKTEKDLLDIPNIGKASVREIGLAVYTAKQSENQ